MPTRHPRDTVSNSNWFYSSVVIRLCQFSGHVVPACATCRSNKRCMLSRIFLISDCEFVWICHTVCYGGWGLLLQKIRNLRLCLFWRVCVNTILSWTHLAEHSTKIWGCALYFGTALFTGCHDLFGHLRKAFWQLRTWKPPCNLDLSIIQNVYTPTFICGIRFSQAILFPPRNQVPRHPLGTVISPRSSFSR